MCPNMPVRAASTVFLVRVWRLHQVPTILAITPSLVNSRVQTWMSQTKIHSTSLELVPVPIIWLWDHTTAQRAQKKVHRPLTVDLNCKPPVKVTNVTNSKPNNLIWALIKLTVDSKQRRTHQKEKERKRTWTRCCQASWLHRTLTNTRLSCARCGWLVSHANSVIRAIMHTASNS